VQTENILLSVEKRSLRNSNFPLLEIRFSLLEILDYCILFRS
jgi:hypothetical protein